jgi:negative regulator of sigma E activity
MSAMDIAHQMPFFNVKRWLSRSVMVGVGAVVSLGLGLVPSIQPNVPAAGQPLTVSFGSAAYAQSISDQEVANYARSVLAIEPLRQSAYDQIKGISGSVPRIECHRPSSLNDLPDNVRQIAVNYCNQAISIVESNSLTISRFNAIRVAQDSDSSLLNRIQQSIMELR